MEYNTLKHLNNVVEYQEKQSNDRQKMMLFKITTTDVWDSV